MLRLRSLTTPFLAALAIAASLGAPAVAGPDVEEGSRDAGGTAKSATVAKGAGPALQLSGTLSTGFVTGDVVDMFLIYVPNPATFVAKTDAATAWDTQLWLFRVTFDALGNPLAAYAIAGNDDDPTIPGTLSSRVTFPVGATQYGPGVYAVAITPFKVRGWGVSTGGAVGEVFSSTLTNGLYLPSGFGLERPVAYWDGPVGTTPGSYHVFLTNATLIPPGTGSAVCGDIFSGDCFVAHTTTVGCKDPTCCQIVCAADPACCTIAWDAVCAVTAQQNCFQCIVPVNRCPADLNGDGIVNGADLGLLLTAWGVCP